MSNADRLRLALIEESEYAETPVTVRASVTLTLDTQPTAAETITLGTRVYTFRAALTGAADEILIDAGGLSGTQQNLIDAINHNNDGPGHSAETSHEEVFADDAFDASDDLLIFAKVPGAGGNGTVSTTTMIGGGNAFSAGTLTGGSGTATGLVQRITSEGLMQDTSTTQTSEIREDRQVEEVLRTNVQASGDINFELSFGSQETLLLAALMVSAFGSPITDIAADTGIDADAATNSLIGGSGDFANYSAGEWVRIGGFAEGANNGVAKIVQVYQTTDPNDSIELSHITLVDEAAGESVSVTQFGSATNGVVQRSFTVEKKFQDLEDNVHVLRGMHVDQFDMTVAVEQIVTGVFNMVGKSMTVDEKYQLGTTYTPAPTTQQMTAVDDVLSISEGGERAHGGPCATNFSMSLQNNLRARGCIGELGAASIGVGSLTLTGTLTRYFENNREMQKYLQFVRSSLALILEDADGNQYVFDFPSIKYTSGQAVAGGQNTDIMAEMAWQALRDPTEGITVRVAKLAA